MIDLLKRAFAEAEKLPDGEQEVLAAWILAEISSEGRWTATFRRSLDVLDDLADEALDEHRRKETRPLDVSSWAGEDIVWFWIGSHADYDRLILHP